MVAFVLEYSIHYYTIKGYSIMAFCKQCGIELSKDVQFCTGCGSKLESAETANAAEQTTVEINRTPHDANVPETSVFKKLPKQDAVKLIVKSASKALVKSLALSAAVLGPGFLALMNGAIMLGMIWLFVGSFGLMAWSYRKPWRLGAISCLIPPIAAGCCYLVQLWLFGSAMPPLWAVLLAVGAGAALGFMRGKAHSVYEENGSLFAQRTVAYLAIWVVCYGTTQLLGLMVRETFLVQGGLVSGAFSTAMLAMVSVMLLMRRNEFASSRCQTQKKRD